MNKVTSYRLSTIPPVAACVYFFIQVISGHPLDKGMQLIFIGATAFYLGVSALWVRK